MGNTQCKTCVHFFQHSKQQVLQKFAEIFGEFFFSRNVGKLAELFG